MEKESRIKPEPPGDLWEQLAVLNERVSEAARPADSFTRSEYSAKFGVSPTTAGFRIGLMVKAGQVERHGRGAHVFYTVVKKI